MAALTEPPRRDGQIPRSHDAARSHLAAAKTAHEKTVLQREIKTTDRQIHPLVYEVYGLTEEEIKIVEEATK